MTGMTRVVTAVTVATVSLLSLSCDQAPPANAPAPNMAKEECPHDWNFTGAVASNIKAFTGGRHNVPEYNDCQRFIEGTAEKPRYGAVGAVFISGSWSEKPEMDVGDRKPVALIVAEGAYSKFEIGKAGYYCILLAHPTEGKWEAGIVEAGDNADCNRPNMSTIKKWDVRRKIANDPGWVPGAVRWAFDPLPSPFGWVHYATVPCNGAVCSLGPKGFVDLPVSAILNGMSPGLPANGKYREVDTWGDFQFLAAANNTGSVQPIAPVMYGVMLPANDLDTLKVDHYKDKWIPVAEVALSGDQYKAKWNFSKTFGDTYNRVELCYFEHNPADVSDTGGCQVPATKNDICQTHDPAPTAGTPRPGRWRSRHINAIDGTVSYHCIELREFNPSLAVPGTARWKWDVQDEKAWFRCPAGCCLEQE